MPIPFVFPVVRVVAAALLAFDLAGAAAQTPPEPAPPSAAAPARRPIEHFARVPRVAGVALSPDGKQIALLLNTGGKTAVVTRSLVGDATLRVAMHTDNVKFGFNWARWVGNERLLVSVGYPSRRHFVATVETRLFSVKPDGSELLALRRADTGGRMGPGRSQQLQDEVIDWLPGDGRHVLLQLADAGGEPAVYRVNVENASRRIVAGAERGVYGWFTDAAHQVRVGLRDDLKGGYEVIARDRPGDPWRTLWKFDDEDDAVWPLGFGADPQELFVQAAHEGRLAVFAVRLDDPTLPRRLLLADKEGDVEGRLLRMTSSGEALGLRGTAADEASAATRLWSPRWRALVEKLEQALPGMAVRLVDFSHDGQRYVAYASGNGLSGGYYVGNVQTGELALLAEAYPELADAPLAGKKAALIPARDGLPLRAYLTLPAGRDAAAGPRLPLVLLPHGGPASRDDADFDPWTEFLADRGYAVLQVNFRGSRGYGSAFRNAGLKRWGLEMQDDLTDAVQWAVDQGLADPTRVCIVGGSYGGYAALMGAVKTPQLYRCAVSFAGVSDLPDLIAHVGDYLGGRWYAQKILGDAWDDRDRLRETSPALNVQRIRAPVLLVHGSLDRVVPVEQSQAMARALRSAGKAHRYVEQEGGDHHLHRQADRLQFFRELEAFLDQHLGGGPQ